MVYSEVRGLNLTPPHSSYKVSSGTYLLFAMSVAAYDDKTRVSPSWKWHLLHSFLPHRSTKADSATRTPSPIEVSPLFSPPLSIGSHTFVSGESIIPEPLQRHWLPVVLRGKGRLGSESNPCRLDLIPLCTYDLSWKRERWVKGL